METPYVQSRDRPFYEKGLHGGDFGDLARQMERDMRLQDMDDLDRQVRWDHSTLVERGTSERQYRDLDLDPDVHDNTKYNRANLNYSMNQMQSDSHHSSGYVTEVQPTLLPLSTTSSGTQHRSSRGWYNRRGDQWI